MESDMRALRGVNIAAAVLSGFGILLSGVLLIFLALSSSALNDPVIMGEVVEQLESSGGSSSAFDGSTGYDYDYSGMSSDELASLANAGMGVLIAMVVAALLFKALCLFAALTALKALRDPSKLGRAFGLAIASIVVSVLDGSWVSLVLFIVSMVFINRLRRAAAYGASGQPFYGGGQPVQWQQGQGQQGQPQQPNSWGQQQSGQWQQPGQQNGWQQPGQPGQQPQGQAPQQPVAQPQQPMAPANPQPQQPIQPQQPVAQQDRVPQPPQPPVQPAAQMSSAQPQQRVEQPVNPAQPTTAENLQSQQAATPVNPRPQQPAASDDPGQSRKDD